MSLHRSLITTMVCIAAAATTGCTTSDSSTPDSSSSPAQSPSRTDTLATGQDSVPPRIDSLPASDSLPPAPWSNPPVRRADVPVVYHEQWSVAANRSTCSLVALTKLGVESPAVPRAAEFSGGWAVAYDMPQLRSAFGIAGSGSLATDDTYSGWPNHLRWSDGSRADYGPEGGTGPNQLAYLRIAGEGCLYNVWSRAGDGHLEMLIDGIRRVR